MRKPSKSIAAFLMRLREWLVGKALRNSNPLSHKPSNTCNDDLVQFEEARALHHQGLLNEAEDIYRTLLQKHPENFELLHGLGMALGQRGHSHAAIGYIERAIAADVKNPAAHGSRGNCFRGLGNYEEALASYDRALTLRPDDAHMLNNRGTILGDLGRPSEAVESYKQALRIDPSHVHALDNLGATLRLLQRPAEALTNHENAIAISPDYLLAHCNRGLALLDLKRPAEACSSFERALDLKPNHIAALAGLGAALTEMKQYEAALTNFDQALTVHPLDPILIHQRGAILHVLGRYDDALTEYQQALRLKPDFTNVLLKQGITLSALGRHSEAVTSFDKVLALEPNHAVAHYNRAIALGEMIQHHEALQSCDRALEIDPAFAEALYFRGCTLLELKRYDAAVDSHDRALKMLPDYADALLGRALALSALNRFEDALRDCDNALAIRPDDVIALSNRGVALRNLGRHEEALASYNRAITLRPAHLDAHNGRAVVLFELKRFDMALAEYDRALQIDPNHADTHMNAALCRLQLGDFARGWEEYEWRWQTEKFRKMRLDIQLPEWKGQKLGGSLLVWNEQGVGDEIFFAGMLKDLAPYSDNITVCVESRLVPLFQRSFENLQVLSRQALDSHMRFDAHIPMGSLGRYLRLSIGAFPHRTKPYLRACARHAMKLRSDISRDNRLICGLSWLSKSPATGSDKSLKLRELAQMLALPEIDFVDLQYGDTTQDQLELHASTGLKLIHVGEIDNFNDIDGLAALICACDVIVTVSNTTAHLAAALGKPVLLMLPFSRGLLWYWHIELPHNPWYSTVSPFRQSLIGDWRNVIDGVCAALTRQHIVQRGTASDSKSLVPEKSA